MTFSERPRRVGVIGTGLIGSSLLRSSGRAWGKAVDVAAHDLRPELESQVRDHGWQWMGSITEIALWADLIFVCVPLPAYGEILGALERAVTLRETGKRLAITDVGSQKAGVVAKFECYPVLLQACDVVLGHPMAGTENSGFDAGLDGLFDGCTWVLCPDLSPSTAALVDIAQLVIALGARVSVLDAGRHDQVVAQISHVPYVLAAIEALLVHRSPERQVALRLAAGSFSDLTRVAGSPPWLSVSMVAGNRCAVESELQQVDGMLHSFLSATADGDEAKLHQMFEDARACRMKFLEARGSIGGSEVRVTSDGLVEHLLGIGRDGGLVLGLRQDVDEWVVSFEPPVTWGTEAGS